jgi:hypothetical protein
LERHAEINERRAEIDERHATEISERRVNEKTKSKERCKMPGTV